jgi:hypothetical protein
LSIIGLGHGEARGVGLWTEEEGDAGVSSMRELYIFITGK